MSNFHVGDIGSILEITVMNGAAAANVSSATVKEIWLRRPDSMILEVKTASFTTDGTDGKLKYTWQSGDLDIAGVWLAEAYVVFGGYTLHSDVVRFDVAGNV